MAHKGRVRTARCGVARVLLPRRGSEGLWRIPLLSTQRRTGPKTATFRQSPEKILQEAPLPVTHHINNVCELRAQTQFICYYHPAAGFPTQRTWLKAIANGHYQSWVGLTADQGGSAAAFSRIKGDSDARDRQLGPVQPQRVDKGCRLPLW